MPHKTVTIASRNPVKIAATQHGFERVFPEDLITCHAFSTPSGVRDQPTSDAEALQGAWNRADAARDQAAPSEYWVGIEGGIEDDGTDMLAFAWVVVLNRHVAGKSRSAAFLLPPPVAQLVRSGKELGEADDLVFQQRNSKQQSGAVGILTRNCIDRRALYEPAVVLALIPLTNPKLFQRIPHSVKETG